MNEAVERDKTAFEGPLLRQNTFVLIGLMSMRRYSFASDGQELDETPSVRALLAFRSNARFIYRGLSSLVVDQLAESSSGNGLPSPRSWLELGQARGGLCTA
jgi:hypothetical protein